MNIKNKHNRKSTDKRSGNGSKRHGNGFKNRLKPQRKNN